jgi:hypothetical protein
LLSTGFVIKSNLFLNWKFYSNDNYFRTTNAAMVPTSIDVLTKESDGEKNKNGDERPAALSGRLG